MVGCHLDIGAAEKESVDFWTHLNRGQRIEFGVRVQVACRTTASLASGNLCSFTQGALCSGHVQVGFLVNVNQMLSLRSYA